VFCYVPTFVSLGVLIQSQPLDILVLESFQTSFQEVYLCIYNFRSLMGLSNWTCTIPLKTILRAVFSISTKGNQMLSIDQIRHLRIIPFLFFLLFPKVWNLSSSYLGLSENSCWLGVLLTTSMTSSLGYCNKLSFTWIISLDQLPALTFGLFTTQKVNESFQKNHIFLFSKSASAFPFPSYVRTKVLILAYKFSCDMTPFLLKTA
jgi:hypothetical protein